MLYVNHNYLYYLFWNKLKGDVEIEFGVIYPLSMCDKKYFKAYTHA